MAKDLQDEINKWNRQWATEKLQDHQMRKAVFTLVTASAFIFFFFDDVL